MKARKAPRNAVRTLKPLEEGVDYKVKGTVKTAFGGTLTEIEIDHNNPHVPQPSKGFRIKRIFLTPEGCVGTRNEPDPKVPWSPLPDFDLRGFEDSPLPISTQEYVKLGHKLHALTEVIHYHRCTLPNGTSGYLLSNDEMQALRWYMQWAVRNTPQLKKGGKGRPVIERIMEYVIYDREVFQERQRTGCSKYDAITAVQTRKPQLPPEVTKKNPYIRRAHSVSALERLLSPARREALMAEYAEELDRPRKEAEAQLAKFRKLMEEREWEPS